MDTARSNMARPEAEADVASLIEADSLIIVTRAPGSDGRPNEAVFASTTK